MALGSGHIEHSVSTSMYYHKHMSNILRKRTHTQNNPFKEDISAHEPTIDGCTTQLRIKAAHHLYLGRTRYLVFGV